MVQVAVSKSVNEANMDDYIKLISTVGFPIVVAGYLLIRLEGTIKALTSSVTKLVIALAKQRIDVDLNGDK